MAKYTRSFVVSAALTAAISLVLIQVQTVPASAQTSTPTPIPTPTPSPSPSPTPTGADSSGGSIGDLAKQRFNQMITNQVLGSVLLGVNEQINCSDCVSAFGSAGSFSAGIHGRQSPTHHLSLLAGDPPNPSRGGGFKRPRPA